MLMQSQGKIGGTEERPFSPLFSLLDELQVHVPRSSAVRGVAGDIEKSACLFAGRAPVGRGFSLHHVSAVRTLPLGHSLFSWGGAYVGRP